MTILGTSGDDSLTGTAGDDTIDGLDGRDTLLGGDGNDVIYDGGGRYDSLSGGAGNDTLYGGDGHNDTMQGDDGNDVIYDGSGDYDTLSGGAGDDTIYGGAGNDWHTGHYGNDLIVFDLGDGQDTVSSPTIYSDVDVIEITGGLTMADIRLVRDSGGSLTIHYGSGGDSIFVSTHFYAETNPVSYCQNATLKVGSATLDLRGGLPFTGTSGADTVRGSIHDDTLSGLGGNDSLEAYAGNDVLYGGDGTDTLAGGDGNDVLYDGNGNADLARGGAGSDTVYGGDGHQDTLYGDAGNDVIYDGAGDYDVVYGDNLTDTGSDTIYGGAGRDWHYGGYGSDLYVFDLGDGQDTVASPSIYSDVDVIEIAGGLTMADIRLVRDSGNSLTIHYGTGGDSIFVSTHFYAETNPVSYCQTATLKVGGATLDLRGGLPFTGTSGADTVLGSMHSDVLTGLAGHDTMSAGNGNDTLAGGLGNDSLTGGGGSDDFVFAAAASNGTDVITDFVHGTDRLVFTGTDYGVSSGYLLSAAEFTAGSAAVGTGAQFIWDAGTGHLYWDADGTGAGTAVDLALIGIGATLTRDDLVFS